MHLIDLLQCKSIQIDSLRVQLMQFQFLKAFLAFPSTILIEFTQIDQLTVNSLRFLSEKKISWVCGRKKAISKAYKTGNFCRIDWNSLKLRYKKNERVQYFVFLLITKIGSKLLDFVCSNTLQWSIIAYVTLAFIMSYSMLYSFSSYAI